MRRLRRTRATHGVVRSLRRRVRTAGGDQGATLILALVFITVIAVAIAGVLTVTFANLRATEALRDQAAAAAAADGAAQIAINALRRGELSCGSAPATLAVPPVPDGTISATVECSPDIANSQPSLNPNFPWALLTLPATNEEGIRVDVNGPGNNTPAVFAGNVSSTGRIVAQRGILDVTNGGQITAPECVITNPQGKIRVGATLYTQSPPPPPGCQASGQPDPNRPLPIDAAQDLPPDINPTPTYFNQLGEQFNPTCVATGQQSGRTNRIVFRPGAYSNPNSLNAAANCGPASGVAIEFEPGVYWFNFPSTNAVWSVSKGTLNAGCAIPDTGVLFVFGSHSQWRISGNAQVQVCARELPVSGPPPTPGTEFPDIAIYGLRPSDDQSWSWIDAQTGCVTAANGCKFLQVMGSSATQVDIRGTIYAPLGWFDISLTGTGTYEGSLSGGIVARRFSLASQSPLTFSSAASVAPPGPGEAQTVVNLAVYVCPGSATCDTSGAARLTAKVGVVGSPARVAVYSWNVTS